MKLNNNELEKLAKKLHWSLEESKTAINELSERACIANYIEVIKICLEFKDKERRWDEILKFLLEISYQDLSTLIYDQLLNPDPCFDVVVTFNTADENNSSSKLYEYHGKKSFLFRSTYLELHGPLVGYKTHKTEIPLLDSYYLCYDFLDRIVNKKYREGLDVESLLLEIVSRVGFMAFEIEVFKKKSIEYSSRPSMNHFATRLARAIAEPMDKKEITQRGYWLTYVLVERVRHKYGLRGAFRRIGQVTGQKTNSIQPRYFDRKKKAKEEGISLNEIIVRFYLQKPLIEIEQKLQEQDINQET